MLEELAPILCLQSDVGVTPNVTGKSSGGSSAHDIDWELDIPSFHEKRFLLEVKLRHGDLSAHLEEIVASASGLVHAPRTDPDNFFANIAHKFENNNPCDVLQGAWVATWIKPERSAINTAFNRLPECVHFVLIVPPGVRQRSAYLLSRDSPDVSRTQILEIFGLHHDPSLLFESEDDTY